MVLVVSVTTGSVVVLLLLSAAVGLCIRKRFVEKTKLMYKFVNSVKDS